MQFFLNKTISYSIKYFVRDLNLSTENATAKYLFRFCTISLLLSVFEVFALNLQCFKFVLKVIFPCILFLKLVDTFHNLAI